MSDADWVVHDGPQHAFFERLGAVTKEKHVLPGFYHDTLGERDRAVALAEVRTLPARTVRRGRRSASTSRRADRRGFTKDEADALRAAAARRLSPRGLYWGVTRAALALRRHALRRVAGRSRDRIRFRQHAGLRVSQHGIGTHAARPAVRPHLPRLGRLARHPPAQAARRGTVARRDATAAGARPYRCASSTSPPAAAATCSTRSRTPTRVPTRSCCATTARSTSATVPRSSRSAGLGRHRALRQRRCVRPREPRRPSSRARRSASCRGSSNCFPTTRGGAIARRSRRRAAARRLPRLHVPAVAPAARADRARAQEPSRRRGVGDAPAHPGRDGPAGRAAPDSAS